MLYRLKGKNIGQKTQGPQAFFKGTLQNFIFTVHPF